ncbi:restriction endonuclease subunit S [Algiphilus sp. W345]|uniref:Restriction endonuclease subunit S n=1 Tax=Banduia mediterranea TaxID=3075609 RepID=A0ABU2WP53_9GAMM|nr:restriction endonuclease subunit S [Algiphilus sp. W345]MDT0499126.1 restriction endonuclease subunit S [Algiphilus sp. W345]
MASEWATVPLSELTSTPPTYGVVQPGQDTASGSPMLRVNNFQGHSLNLSEVMRIAPEIEAKYGRTRIQTGDVLLTIVGSVGQVAVVPYELSGWNIARAIAMIRPNKPELSRWISLVLRSPQAQYQLGVTANTTVQTTINLKDLRELRIPLPADGERDAIAHILGTLDDKIECNRCRNQTLEAMARALFQDWFVDFGPVRAKMEGREPYLPADLWQIFPDRLDDEGKPEGWDERPLDEVADFLNGLALQKFPATDPDDSLPVIKIAELRSGVSAKSDRASREVPPKYVIKDGDFLFSWSGSLLAKFWTEGEGALNQHLFKVTSERYPMWFVSHWVHHHLEEFQAIAASKATTMGHIQRGHLKAAMTICPPDDVLERMGIVMAPLVEQVIQNELESRTLAQIRDTLLPKLISGELCIADAATFMERVEAVAT